MNTFSLLLAVYFFQYQNIHLDMTMKSNYIRFKIYEKFKIIPNKNNTILYKIITKIIMISLIMSLTLF